MDVIFIDDTIYLLLLYSIYFQALFENADFEVDSTAEEYRLLNPVLSRLDKGKAKAKRQESEAMEVCVSLTYFEM